MSENMNTNEMKDVANITNEVTKEKERSKREKILLLLLLLLLIGFVALGAATYYAFFGNNKNANDNENINVTMIGGGYDTTDIGGMTAPKGHTSSIDISGFSELYIIDDQYVPLQNPDTNSVCLMYRIYDASDNLLYESNVIAPGKEDRWFMGKDFDPGQYEFKFVVYKVTTDSKPVAKLNFKAVIHYNKTM